MESYLNPEIPGEDTPPSVDTGLVRYTGINVYNLFDTFPLAFSSNYTNFYIKSHTIKYIIYKKTILNI